VGPIAVFLCDYTGIMARPWAAAGIECYCVDIQHSIRNDRVDGNTRFVWGDVRTWRPPEGREICFVAAFPFCTHDAVSGARDFEKKGGMMLRDSLEVFEACRLAGAWSGAPYCLEHPVTMLTSIPHIGKPDHYFNPNEYGGYPGGEGDAYTKKTCLWTGNGFVMPEPRPIPATEGSRMHGLPPSEERANLRSATPAGFARAVFEANNPIFR